MPFNAKLPEWFAVGLEPNTSQKTTGYEPKVKPPAQWFNWHLNTTYLALKELQEEAVNQEVISSRFDTITRQTAVLAAGSQVINSQKPALFVLNGLKGAMFVNLLGGEGGCEAIGNWSSSGAIAVDKVFKTSGTGSLKMTVSVSSVAVTGTFLTTPGKRYIAVADVRNNNTTKTDLTIRKGDNSVLVTGSNITENAAWDSVYALFTASDFYHLITLTGMGAPGTSFNMDSVRVYEVSGTTYTDTAGLPGPQVAKLFPFVNSIMPVRNPYAIRWTDSTKTTIASMLAFQTDLYADPLTGANADTNFKRDGKYFKNKNWQGMTLDGSLPWAYKDTKVGNKQVTLPLTGQKTDSERVVKYDGKLITHAYPWDGADQSFLAADGLYISIPVADSGWADSYTPTQDDIKAYFYGYKAYDANTITPANAQAMTTATWSGTGTKYWVQRTGAPNFTQSAPQQSYAGYTPYKVVYQLATAYVEPVVSEGQLDLAQGDNQIEVGTGVVVREESKPALSSQYWINGSLSGLGKLQFRNNKILAIYRNGKIDTNWTVVTHTSGDMDQYGFYQAAINTYKFDPAATYSTTYLTLEPSPPTPFDGSYGANEKTLLRDLVENAQQTTSRVSVLENKKADKDNPIWIAPSLLNGMVVEAASTPVEYIKSSDGIVTVHGSIKPPSTGSFVMFKLSEGYRPKQIAVVMCAGYTGTNDVAVRCVVLATGEVQLAAPVSLTWVRLDGIKFLAEQ